MAPLRTPLPSLLVLASDEVDPPAMLRQLTHDKYILNYWICSAVLTRYRNVSDREENLHRSASAVVVGAVEHGILYIAATVYIGFHVSR